MFELTWQAPYDWPWMWGFLQARAVAGIERFEEGRYTRSFEYNGHCGVITMTPDETRQVLCVTLSEGLLPVAQPCLTRISHLLDLKCEPQTINDTLGTLASARPGLRLPGAMDAFEQGVRAILGQLVSVSMAAKLTGKVVAAVGDPLPDFTDFYLFPRPEQLMNADPQRLKALGMPLKRAESLIYLARAALTGELPLNAPEDIEQGMKALQSFPGIGRWTANYFALRGWQASDVFLPDDYLIKQRFPGMTPAQIRRYAERWHPWRSYALLHIWYTEDWAP
ncbi:DNA-3-methyladenine glycosylase 2 [Pseudocitrobacter vendiensis]|uniref:DNA-3-methyladenine glycosylase II n=1 Tax=Pseudocitrobacter vendiensis TaxID=2488306 RepID=A0ABN8T8M0_9ENTR|nr:DNA-3-methyladenine glycosylase 2 [Pseudocitrobacter vendiensis]CAH6636774.1 DNA-3-methyladenine glycosylase 2 [Pseudocitrobacter vendiensis]